MWCFGLCTGAASSPRVAQTGREKNGVIAVGKSNILRTACGQPKADSATGDSDIDMKQRCLCYKLLICELFFVFLLVARCTGISSRELYFVNFEY